MKEKVSLRLRGRVRNGWRCFGAYQHGGNLLENIDGLGRRGVFIWLIRLGHGELI